MVTVLVLDCRFEGDEQQLRQTHSVVVKAYVATRFGSRGLKKFGAESILYDTKTASYAAMQKIRVVRVDTKRPLLFI